MLVMEREQILEQLHSLNEVSKTIIRCESQEQAIQAALKEVRQRLKVQVASIFLFSKDGVLKRFGIDGVDREDKPIDSSWLTDETYNPGESFSGKAVPSTGLNSSDSTYGKPQYSNNIVKDFPGMKYVNEYNDMLGGLRCGISVPLDGLNRTFGTLEVLNKSDQSGFQAEDLYWLMMIRTTVSNMVSDFGKRKELEEFNKITKQIISLEAERRLNQNEFQKILGSIADDLVSDLTPYKVCILRTKNQNNELEIVKVSTTDDISCEGRDDKPVKVGIGIVGQVFETNTPEYINDITNYQKPYFNKGWIEENGLKSHACVPLFIEGNVVGTISVYTGYKHEFSHTNKSFLTTISFLTAAIIDMVQNKEELRKVKIQLEREKREFHNQVYTQGYDTQIKGFLHEYKNELIDISYNLQKLLSTSGKGNKEKERILGEQIEWIDRRTEAIRSQFAAECNVSKAVNINDLIKKTANFFDLDNGGIEIAIILDKAIPIIEVDETKFKQIIHNLIANAIDAIEKANPKQGKMTIKTYIVTSNSIEYIQISIEDNGVGIPNEIKDEIFKKGFSARRSQRGTGMGLYVVSEILREHGGRIHYDSTVGRGTTFFVNIPLKRYLYQP